MLSHVLVPLDGSELAAEALEPAKQILRPGGSMTLVMAIEIPQNWNFGGAPIIVFDESQKIAEQLKHEARAYLAKIAAQLVNEGLIVQTLVTSGDAAVVILENARAHQVDAIVMSTHGRSGFRRWLYGSVTGKVLSAASCPVYVIPNREPAAGVQAVSQEAVQA